MFLILREKIDGLINKTVTLDNFAVMRICNHFIIVIFLETFGYEIYIIILMVPSICFSINQPILMLG